MVGFPGGTSGKEPACQFRRCRRREFDPWRRKLQHTPVFLPGKSHGWGAWQSAVHGAAKSHTQLKHSVCTHNNGTFLQGALVFAWQGYCHFKSKDYIKTHDLACDLLWGVLFQWVSPWGVPLGHFSSLWRQSLVWRWILPKNWAFFLKHLITKVSFSGQIKM